LDQALAFSAAKGEQACTLLDDQITIDVNGNVALCCASSMDRANTIGSFLELPLDEIQRRRNRHTLCGPCMELGVPSYLKSQPEFEGIAEAFLKRPAATLVD
jgi:phosphopantothenate synthetase